MKNLGLMGGLLMLADFGTGPLSWDEGLPSPKTSGKLTSDESGESSQNSELLQWQQAQEILNRRHCFDCWVVLK